MTDKQYNVKQCLLQETVRTDPSVPKFSYTSQTSWIPEKFAVEGKYLELYDFKNDSWKTWRVRKVYDFAVDYEYIRERSQDYKRTRKASDI